MDARHSSYSLVAATYLDSIRRLPNERIDERQLSMKSVAPQGAVDQPEFYAGASASRPVTTISAQTTQYSLAQILGVWLLAAAPMGLLAWVVFPALVNRVSMHPGLLLWALMIAGLMWQVALALIILYRETGTLSLPAIRHRTWRQQTRDPRTG